MANTLKSTLNNIGNTIETITGTKKPINTNPTTVPTNTGQTCLERFGMEARKSQLMKNEWRKDLQYTKNLVSSEYKVQTEFKISSRGEMLEEVSKGKMSKELSENKTKQVTKQKKKKEKRLKEKQEGEKVTDSNGNVTHYNKPQEVVIQNDLSYLEYAGEEYIPH